MSDRFGGKLADPKFRHKRAADARAAQTTPAYHAHKLAQAIEPLSDEQVAELREQVARSRARQGLPPAIEDPGVIEKIASVFRLTLDHEGADDAA